MKDYTPWNFIKPVIDNSSIDHLFFREREIWWCSIGMNIGHEEENKYYIPFIHGSGDGQAMISQIRLLSSKRLSRKISTLSFEEYRKIIDAFKNIL